MNSFIILLLMLVMVYFIRKNITLGKRNKKIKAYSVCAKALYKQDENALMIIDEYMGKEVDPLFVNKARIIKAVVELQRGLDPKPTLELFDLKQIAYNAKGAFSAQQVKFNSDSFAWMIVFMIEAYFKDEAEYAEIVYEKMESISELNNDLAFNIAKAIKSLYEDNNNEEATSFLRELTLGNYSNYVYDKYLIGVYKYLAVVALKITNAEMNEQDEIDLKEFVRFNIGTVVMKDLGIYDTYAPKVEELDEETTEETNESVETIEEETEKPEMVVEATTSEIEDDAEEDTDDAVDGE